MVPGGSGRRAGTARVRETGNWRLLASHGREGGCHESFENPDRRDHRLMSVLPATVAARPQTAQITEGKRSTASTARPVTAPEGKGDGTLSKSLRKRPADLTQLARKPGSVPDRDGRQTHRRAERRRGASQGGHADLGRCVLEIANHTSRGCESQDRCAREVSGNHTGQGRVLHFSRMHPPRGLAPCCRRGRSVPPSLFVLFQGWQECVDRRSGDRPQVCYHPGTRCRSA